MARLLMIHAALLLAALTAVAAPAHGAERYERGSLTERWSQAQAAAAAAAKPTWIGWSVDRWADPNGFSFAGGWYFGGSRFALRGRPLSVRLGAADAQPRPHAGPPPQSGWERRPLAILVHVDKSGSIDRVITTDFQVPVNLREDPLSWLDRHDPATSITRLANQLETLGIAGSTHLRESVITAIALHGDPAAFEVLAGITRAEPNAELRDAAAEGLPWQHHPRALPLLLELIAGDPSQDVRRTAVESLGDLPPAEGLPVLAKIAHTHEDRDLGEEAIETLGDMGRRQPRAREALLRLLALHSG
ncbi:MAG: HEAT repeat domain-containing protein [Pseudomonadota bacterium]